MKPVTCSVCTVSCWYLSSVLYNYHTVYPTGLRRIILLYCYIILLLQSSSPHWPSDRCVQNSCLEYGFKLSASETTSVPFDSLKYNQQQAMFSRSIYFYKLLYMYQAVPPPIIRSTKLYIQRQILSNKYCCLLLSWMRWNSMEFHLIHDSSRQQYWFDNT